ncbi:PEP-CTERM sorting domain-containing protein [Luteolibacter sp. Populi]|uniref:PEP-CTERM sorting domain-containing protein n=1 Tax=Luteolibacter sp. Populi TaxID=3230487 RepID=UPI003465F47F
MFTTLSPSRFPITLVVVLAGMTAGKLCAATITGGLSVPIVYSSVDISAGTDDWAYYGLSGPSAITSKAGGPGSFSSLSGTFAAGGDSRMFLSFSGGDPVPSVGSGTAFVFPNQVQGAALSFTATVLAESQTIRVYLVGYDSRADISAALGEGGSFSLENAVLPYTDDGDGSGGNHTSGLLTLNLSGATVGDTLTFTVANDYVGVNDSSFGFVGIQAVTVTVPEPSSLVVGLGGLVLLGLRRRR